MSPVLHQEKPQGGITQKRPERYPDRGACILHGIKGRHRDPADSDTQQAGSIGDQGKTGLPDRLIAELSTQKQD